MEKNYKLIIDDKGNTPWGKTIDIQDLRALYGESDNCISFEEDEYEELYEMTCQIKEYLEGYFANKKEEG